MPTYDYLCEEHGAFSAFKPISQYKDPEPCPECGREKPRAMLTAPQVRGTSSSSSDSGGSPAWLSGMKRHGGGCACC